MVKVLVLGERGKLILMEVSNQHKTSEVEMSVRYIIQVIQTAIMEMHTVLKLIVKGLYSRS